MDAYFHLVEARCMTLQPQVGGSDATDSDVQRVSVHPNFIVIAIGAANSRVGRMPGMPSRGNPLDPPLSGAFSHHLGRISGALALPGTFFGQVRPPRRSDPVWKLAFVGPVCPLVFS